VSDARLRTLERRWRESGAESDRAAYLAEWRRVAPEDVRFVYRSHYEGPLAKRTRALPGRSVLEWFQQAFDATSGLDEAAVEDWCAEALGGEVYGFGSLFHAAREEGLARPASWAELARALDEHLYVEGEVRTDVEAVVRALTDDGEVELAYAFFDAGWAAAHPGRVAYPLLDGPALPLDAPPAGAPFDPPVPAVVAGPPAAGAGTTWALCLTFSDGESLSCLDHALRAFPGVRLPGLAAHLRDVDPDDDWPRELLALRALVDPADDAVDPALERLAAVDLTDLDPLFGPYPEVRARLEREGLPPTRGDAAEALAWSGPHVAQLCHHTDPFFGFQQVVLFDDLWAAAHPDLAASLLRYARSWDPLE